MGVLDGKAEGGERQRPDVELAGGERGDDWRRASKRVASAT